MNNDSPVWYKLIHYWCRQRVPKGYGLTIPFVIGSLEGMTISDLLHEIKESQLTDKIILRMCYDLEEYVLSVDDIDNPIASHLSGEKALLYYDKKIESLKSFEEVIAYLDSKYSERIASETYSKNLRTRDWETYTSVDKETIINALRN